METLVIFGVLSIAAIAISWRTLLSLKSHGFYRFFSWECIIWLFANNYPFWFKHPFGVEQLFSWTFLLFAIYLVQAGARLLNKAAKSTRLRDDKALYSFEKTSELIDYGIFKYIRHPLYSSLIFLTWGIFLKNPTVILCVVAIGSTVLLYITARYDEKECIGFFGESYREYRQRSKMFIPFIL